jgi:carboxymethylenebutenolidase
MDKMISRLYSDYRQGGINRRDFLRKLVMYTGTTAAAMTLLPMLEDNFARAGNVTHMPDVSPTEDDSGLFTEMITYPGETGDVLAFTARPLEESKYPAVIIIHENRGLQPHIKDVTRRMAKEGFLSMAPDALSPAGGTPDDDPDKAGSMMRELDPQKTMKNFVAAVAYLKTHPLSTGKVGCTGFCWGGAMTNQVAVNAPDLDAAVPYYGRQPSAEETARIKAPLLAHYAGNDEGINSGIPAFEEALKKAGVEYSIFMYEGASHAFNNDSNPARYNEQAAKLAWERTIAFFRDKLKG